MDLISQSLREFPKPLLQLDDHLLVRPRRHHPVVHPQRTAIGDHVLLIPGPEDGEHERRRSQKRMTPFPNFPAKRLQRPNDLRRPRNRIDGFLGLTGVRRTTRNLQGHAHPPLVSGHRPQMRGLPHHHRIRRDILLRDAPTAHARNLLAHHRSEGHPPIETFLLRSQTHHRRRHRRQTRLGIARSPSIQLPILHIGFERIAAPRARIPRRHHIHVTVEKKRSPLGAKRLRPSTHRTKQIGTSLLHVIPSNVQSMPAQKILQHRRTDRLVPRRIDRPCSHQIPEQPHDLLLLLRRHTDVFCPLTDACCPHNLYPPSSSA